MAEAGSIFSDIVPSVTSGTQLATLLNDFKNAVAGGFYTDTGTRPTNLAQAGYWIDLQNDPVWSYKIFDGTNDREIFQLNVSTGAVSFGDTASPLTLTKDSDDTIGAILKLLKKRTTGTQTLDGDTLGEINFVGVESDSTEQISVRIQAVSTDDITASANGGYLTFSTTPDNGSTLTERMRINTDGKVGFGETSPQSRIHVKGSSTTGNIKNTVEEDSAVPPTMTLNKRRSTGTKQTQTSDEFGRLDFSGTDENTAEVTTARIKTTATENSQSTQHGTSLAIQTVKTGETTLGDRLQIDGAGDVTVPGNFTVTGDLTIDGTTTTVNTSTLDVEDTNITVNNGGNDASSEGAGLTVERTGTDGSLVYEDALASKFKIGALGSEVEVADVSSTQTFTNKTLSTPSVQTPSRSDVKQDTEANLTTYAATATNGQYCFATDTKKYYVVRDNALILDAGASDNVNLSDTQTMSNKSFSNETTHAEITTPSTPSANDWKLYFKAGGLHQLDDAGNELNLSLASSGGAWTNGGAITIEGTTTNPTKGTTTADKFWYKLINGNTLVGFLEYEQTTAGSAGSGDYLFTVVPSGYEIDLFFDRSTTGLNDYRAIQCGGCFTTNTVTESSTTAKIGVSTIYDATRIRFMSLSSTSDLDYIGSGITNLAAPTRIYYAYFTIPVVAI